MDAQTGRFLEKIHMLKRGTPPRACFTACGRRGLIAIAPEHVTCKVCLGRLPKAEPKGETR